MEITWFQVISNNALRTFNQMQLINNGIRVLKKLRKTRMKYEKQPK